MPDRQCSFAPLSRIALAGTLISAVLAGPGAAQGAWPTWGGDETRAMHSGEVGLPGDFYPGDYVGASAELDPKTARNVKWIARLGSQTYGNPTVAGGRVFVGTNNDVPRDPRFAGDRSCVYCFDEATGEFLWQLNAPKLGTGMVSDWEYVGMCAAPSVEGDRAYMVTNRCEVICLDVNGLADGNAGPYQDEAQYLAGPEAEPILPSERDADIIWMPDMMVECGVRPHNVTSSSVLIADDLLWVTTSNGADVDHRGIPAADAPSLIAVDKATGKLAARESSGISGRMFHACWTSPAYLRSDGGDLCIFGGPDGFGYGFSSVLPEAGTGTPTLREVWSVDCNPAEYREKDGAPVAYTSRRGPSEILATPVTYEGRAYFAIGQEPDYCDGPGNLLCADATGEVVWSYAKINRTMSTPAIANGLLFAADYAGFVYCLDARTGEELWIHDTMGHIWGSPLVADGRVYIGNEDAYMIILPASKEFEKKAVTEVDVKSPVYSSAIAANGVLYVTTQTHLFAIALAKDD